jgi:hypothetical protein
MNGSKSSQLILTINPDYSTPLCKSKARLQKLHAFSIRNIRVSTWFVKHQEIPNKMEP